MACSVVCGSPLLPFSELWWCGGFFHFLRCAVCGVFGSLLSVVVLWRFSLHLRGPGACLFSAFFFSCFVTLRLVGFPLVPLFAVSLLVCLCGACGAVFGCVGVRPFSCVPSVVDGSSVFLFSLFWLLPVFFVSGVALWFGVWCGRVCFVLVLAWCRCLSFFVIVVGYCSCELACFFCALRLVFLSRSLCCVYVLVGCCFCSLVLPVGDFGA